MIELTWQTYHAKEDRGSGNWISNLETRSRHGNGVLQTADIIPPNPIGKFSYQLSCNSMDALVYGGAVVWIMFWLIGLGRCGSNFKSIIFKLIMQDTSLGTRREIALRFMPQIFINKSTLVLVMAWCRQASSHYLAMLTHWSLNKMSDISLTKFWKAIS